MNPETFPFPPEFEEWLRKIVRQEIETREAEINKRVGDFLGRWPDPKPSLSE